MSFIFLHFVNLCTVEAQQCLFVQASFVSNICRCAFHYWSFYCLRFVCIVLLRLIAGAVEGNYVRYFKATLHHFLLASFVMLMSNLSVCIVCNKVHISPACPV